MVKNKVLCLVAVKRSLIEQKDWKTTKQHIVSELKNEGLECLIIAKIFGKDEFWVICKANNIDEIYELEDRKEFVIYVAALLKATSLDTKIVKDVINKKLPVGYLLFRKKTASLSDIEYCVKNSSGKPFLVGRIDHPKGFTHAVIFTAENINALNEAAYTIIHNIKCKHWEFVLGVKHGWPKAVQQKKIETIFNMGEIINDWMSAAERGELSDIEREMIEHRFGIQLPKPSGKERK